MRFLFVLLVGAFAAWIFAPVGGLSAAVPAPQRPAALPGLPWLSVSSAQIVDGDGRRVILRGFNDDALLESTMHPAPLDSADARLMQQSGFDVVRVPIAWSLLEPERGVFDTSYLNRIAAAVQLLNAHGLYVVLDMHFLGWSPKYGGSGAPAWATVGGVPDPVWGPMPSMQRFLSPAINISTAYFWITSNWQTQFLDTWTLVARRFRDDSGVAGYDIINEPHSFPLPPFRFDKDQLFPFYAKAITTIAAADPNHIFFIENDMVGDLPTWIVPLSAPNLVYAPHVYTGSLFGPDFNGDTSPLRTHVDELAREAESVPAALWFGEFSISIQHGKAAQWIDAVLDDYAAHDAGWAWWQWRESSSYGIRNAAGTWMDMPLLRLLARPYVVAAPPGVTSGAGPQGAATSLAVNVPPAATATSAAIAWPEYTLGPPHASDSCGAPVSWDAAAARVLVNVPVSTSCVIEVWT